MESRCKKLISPQVLALLTIFSSMLLPVPAGEAGGIIKSGSGFFITANGYFVTNHHVIKGADQIRVTTETGVLNARVVTSDPVNDIAVLKVEGNFSFLPLGRASQVALGQEVFTIGFPNPSLQGVSPKLTKGEISATSGIRDDPRLFQISIPVQPGNSGGPVIDESGEVVGVVSASLSTAAALAITGTIPQNVNYAIKSSYISVLLEGIPQVEEELTKARPPSAANQLPVIQSAKNSVGMVLIYGPASNSEPAPVQEVPAQGAGRTRHANVAVNQASKSYKVTGPIVGIDSRSITLLRGRDQWEIMRSSATEVHGSLLIGAPATVTYYMVTQPDSGAPVRSYQVTAPVSEDQGNRVVLLKG